MTSSQRAPRLLDQLADSVRSITSSGIVANAASLFGATLVTSVLGFAFWAVAARIYAVDDIGTASAAISAMMLLATIGVLGLGTLIIGEIQRVKDPAALIATSSLIAGLGCAGLALAAVAFAPLLSLRLGQLQSGGLGIALFTVGVALTGITVVLDQACIGLLRGGLQFWRNAAFALTKLLLLPLGLLVTHGEVALYTVWAVGNALSLGTLYLHARRLGLRPALTVSLHAMRGLRLAALNHHWLNLSSTAPRLLLPVIVLASLGARTTAAFYGALLLASFVNIIPIHLSTALFALSRGDAEGLRRGTRSSIRLSVGIGVAATLVFLVMAGPLLHVLGSEYTRASSSLVLLVLGTLPMAVKALYIAVRRVQDRLGRAALAITVGGLLEVALPAAGAQTGKLLYVTLGYLVAQVAEAIVFWPTVAAAADLGLLTRLRNRR
jgi:O-antigen/teichoic acid export membrane protein